MISLVFFLASLALVAAVDPNCTTVDTTGALVFTPAATACQDTVAQTVCDQLFNGGTANTALPAPGQPETPNRVVGCYQTKTPAAPSQDVKNAAIDICPKYCGFCCVTPAYSCTNSATPRINCATVTPDMCQSTQWRNIIAQDCPNVCGFCLLGGCIDAAPDCATQATICSNTALTSFITANCQRTCGLCTGSSTTSSSGSVTTATGTGTCGDVNTSCANWARNGFCTSTFYSQTQKSTTCGKTCGLC